MSMAHAEILDHTVRLVLPAGGRQGQGSSGQGAQGAGPAVESAAGAALGQRLQHAYS